MRLHKRPTIDQKTCISKSFEALGFSVLYWNDKPSANGVDCWVQKNNGRPLSVEVKLIREHSAGSMRCDPVSKARTNDDLIAIIVNPAYVLIEPMKDHLKACSPKGTRQLTLIFNGHYD